ncbi:MAG TPA: hypothetical protein VFO66_08065 [Gemmatimonadaceae bacterium]|nr:hypothetical protein [Gemmatimonadaceae bacterium]
MVDSTARVERPGEIRAALIAVGAVSPGTARARAEFPLLDDGAFDALVRQGVIREAAPGTFYVFHPEAQSHDWPRVLKGLLFWLVMLLIPVLLIQFIG